MTRGIRNNNPLNLRRSASQWKGKRQNGEAAKRQNGEAAKRQNDEAAKQQNSESEFEQFENMYYGFRAAILTIETYMIRHHLNTLQLIISRWAPESDGNNTNQYVQHVCHLTGIGGNEPLSNHDPRLKDIVWAMAQIESGKDILQYKDDLNQAFDDFQPKTVYKKEREKHHEY